jgi:peptidoglycan hydrolase CwlO-like protein
MNEPVDLYVKFEQRGKKSSNESTLTMLVSKEGGFITSSSDRNTFEAAEKFMNGLVNQAAIYKLQKAIEDQEDELKDAEKKYSRLQDDEKSMEKKIENLQKDLKENREDQKSQQRTVEEEKKKLEQLKDEMKKYS